jgi:hypothetical protein
MDKLEIKQGSFIQQTQYFIPVEINLSVVPARFQRGRETMFRLITIDFSLLYSTSPCELSEREVISPSNLKVVGALDNYSLVFVIFIIFFGQLKD